MKTPLEISKPIAPEDVREDDYVTILRQTVEILPLCADEGWLRQIEATRVRVTPGCAGYPFRVIRVSLPFVLVRDPRGKHFTLDVRRHEIARLGEAYGRKAFKCFEREASSG